MPERETFYMAQEAMCGCFCKDGLGQCRSSSMESGFDCIDLNKADNANCGACGRSCPPKTEWFSFPFPLFYEQYANGE